MDDVIQEFVILLSGGLTSEEIIRLLSQSNPSQVKIESQADYNSSFLPFSTMVQLGSVKKIVKSDNTQISATSKACSDAYDWLMKAAKENLPPQMNKDNSQSNNIQKHSRASSVGRLPFELQKFSDELQTNEYFKDYDNGFNLNGGDGRCDSETSDFSSTVCSLSRVDSLSINNEPILSPVDLKWLKLINNFNSVYEPKNSAISSIEAIISNDPAIFEIISKYDLSRKIYVTTAINENLGTFTGEDEAQAMSKSTALILLFDELRKIAGLFSSFKSIYSSGIQSCLTQMDLFLSLNRDLITVQSYPKSGLLYQASIVLSKLKHFNAVANNKEEARSDAYVQMAKYMQMYCERINETKLASNYDRFGPQPHGKRDGGAFPGNRQGYTYQRPTGPNESALPSSMCNELVDIIANFNKIYDSRNVVESMEQLMDLNKKMFEKERITTRGRNGERQYETKIKFSSAIFNGVDASKTQSNVKAITAVRNRLLRFSEMFEYFRKEYYSKTDVHHFKLQIFSHHEEVLKLKTRERGIGFQTIISLVHFSDFQGESKNSQDAEEIAFQKFVDYMLALISRLPKTKHELEMEQKQIPILNQNGTEKVLKNNPEFSFEDMTVSKCTRNSNELVNRTSEQSVSNPKVDDKLSKLAKLIKNYNKGITTGTNHENAIRKLNEMNSFVNTQTTQDSPNLFITTVDLIGIGSFYSSQDSQQKSEHDASSKAMEFVQNLNSLWIEFENVYHNPTYSSLEIIEHLIMNDIIKWSTRVVESSSRSRYHSVLLLMNMCSFDRTAETEKDAKKAVAEDCFNFLLKLAKAVTNSN